MQISLTLILISTVSTSPQLECAEKYMDSLDSDVIHALREMRGLDEFIVSTEKDSISVDVARSCSKEVGLLMTKLGVRYPENQLEVLAQAVFLGIKHGGGFNAFVDYLATEYARWETNSDVQPVKKNIACVSDFSVLGGRLRLWTPGQLMYRLQPVGFCLDDRTFWLFEDNAGWRGLDPYERAELCTTMFLQDEDAAEYCTDKSKVRSGMNGGDRH